MSGAQTQVGGAGGWFHSASRGRHAPVVMALAALALVIGLGLVFPGEHGPGEAGAFYDAYTHSSTLGQIAGFTILACGMTVVILTGGIDLSVGSLVALTAVVAGKLARDAGWPGPAAAAAGILAGGACGAVSGLAVSWLRLQPFVATLAMMAFARGLAKRLSDNSKIVMLDLPNGWSLLDAKIRTVQTLSSTPTEPKFFDLPSAVVPASLCVVGVLILLRLLGPGLAVYATGDNETAARYAGVLVGRIKVMAYTLCGLLAGLAGVVFAAREHQANPDGGMGYELTAIAMVVIGGTSLSGGRGGVMLTVLGALTIGYLQKILDINGLDPAQQLMITGAIILLAVLVQGLRQR